MRAVLSYIGPARCLPAYIAGIRAGKVVSLAAWRQSRAKRVPGRQRKIRPLPRS